MSITADLLRLLASKRYEEALNDLKDFIEKSNDEDYNSFIDSLYNIEPEYRELLVMYNSDEHEYQVFYEGKPVGRIDNHMYEMTFYSYETPLGKDFPLMVSAPKRSLEQEPDDDMSVGMFECFDMHVRTGEFFRERHGRFFEPGYGFINYVDQCLDRLKYGGEYGDEWPMN